MGRKRKYQLPILEFSRRIALSSKKTHQEKRSGRAKKQASVVIFFTALTLISLKQVVLETTEAIWRQW